MYLLHIFLHLANRFIDFLTSIELLEVRLPSVHCKKSERDNRDRMTAQLFLTDNSIEIISNGLIYCVFFCQEIMSTQLLIQTLKYPKNKEQSR